MSTWTEWFPLDAKLEYYGPAVYQFRQLKDGKPSPIQRWGGIDLGGILVIGETENLAKRLEDSVNAIRKCSGSTTLNLLHFVQCFSRYYDHYRDFESIQYRFVRFSSKLEAEAEETRLITNYICEFWEPPPLNSKIKERYNGELWTKCFKSVYPDLEPRL